MIPPFLRRFACALMLGAAAAQAGAAPVTARFSGTVTGHLTYLVDASTVAFDEDFPVGTAVSWNLSFDDAVFAARTGSSIDWSLQPASGSLQMGGHDYALRDFRLTGYQLDFSGFDVAFFGAGPDASDWGRFFTLTLGLASDLSQLDVSWVAFGYGAGLGVVTTEGAYSVERGGTVPEPGTALLALSALVGLKRWRRT